MLRLGAVALVAALLLVFAGCGESPEDPQEQEQAEPVQTTGQRDETTPTADATTGPTTSADIPGLPNPDKECRVGEACELGGGTITVTDARIATGEEIDYSGDAIDPRFMVVDVEYTYGGNAPASMSEPPFQLVDEQERLYRPDFIATSDYGISQGMDIYGNVQPGETIPSAAVFPVAPEAEDFTLYIADLVNPQGTGEGNDIATIDL